jgi:hypothetical protein
VPRERLDAMLMAMDGLETSNEASSRWRIQALPERYRGNGVSAGVAPAGSGVRAVFSTIATSVYHPLRPIASTMPARRISRLHARSLDPSICATGRRGGVVSRQVVEIGSHHP